MSVDKGWRGFSEINRVVFDDRKVQLEQLEAWIKESGTYIDTVSVDQVEGSQ